MRYTQYTRDEWYSLPYPLPASGYFTPCEHTKFMISNGTITKELTGNRFLVKPWNFLYDVISDTTTYSDNERSIASYIVDLAEAPHGSIPHPPRKIGIHEPFLYKIFYFSFIQFTDLHCGLQTADPLMSPVRAYGVPGSKISNFRFTGNRRVFKTQFGIPFFYDEFERNSASFYGPQRGPEHHLRRIGNENKIQTMFIRDFGSQLMTIADSISGCRRELVPLLIYMFRIMERLPHYLLMLGEHRRVPGGPLPIKVQYMFNQNDTIFTTTDISSEKTLYMIPDYGGSSLCLSPLSDAFYFNDIRTTFSPNNPKKFFLHILMTIRLILRMIIFTQDEKTIS